jgi:hypothetical protein
MIDKLSKRHGRGAVSLVAAGIRKPWKINWN